MSITTYGKKYGIKLMLILPLLIIIMLVLGGSKPDSILIILAEPLWFLLFLNSIAVSLVGYNLARHFNSEIAISVINVRKVVAGFVPSSFIKFGGIFWKRSIEKRQRFLMLLTI